MRQEEEKDPNLACPLLYMDATTKEIQYKKFEDKQSALQWIHQSENRSILGNDFPYINVGHFEKKTDLDITDLKVIDVELIDPTTGNVLAKEKAAPDTGATVSTFAYDPETFKPLIKSIRTINGKKMPIVYAKLKIDGEELGRIFEVELENDPEEQSEGDKWYAIGIVQIQELSELTSAGIMQKTWNVFNSYRNKVRT